MHVLTKADTGTRSKGDTWVGGGKMKLCTINTYKMHSGTNALCGCVLGRSHDIWIRKIVKCREPPREIPPMTRPCGRELLSKASKLNGLPRLSRASTPKPESVCFTISWLSPTPLTLTGGFSWPPFSGENQLRAIANKSPGHERNISNQNPSVSIIACWAGISRLSQLHIWLFTSSQLWEAWKA